MSARGAVLAALAAGLLAGAFGGALLQRRHHGRRGMDPERALARLSRQLDLDAGQRDAVRAVLERRREKARALQEDAVKRLDELRQATHAEIEPLLRPEQKAKFQKLKERWKRRSDLRRRP